MNALDAWLRLIPEPVRPCLKPRWPDVTALRLAGILGVSVSELGAIRLGPRYHYRPFTINKPDGRERRLLAPSPALKTLQRALLANHLAELPIHRCATAFFSGASTVRNALPHARSQLIATVDLRDFFESTRAARVRRCFIEQGWRDQSLQVLMRLCVFRNGLPQGAPTSPCLSNLANLRLDERLERLAAQSRAVYTRYGDDLTFSWTTTRLPGGFTNAVEDALASAGYKIQPRKGWRIQSIHDRPVVTGIVLAGNGRLSIPTAMRIKMLWLRWQSLWSADEHTTARLRGLEAYVDMVNRKPARRQPRRRRAW